jgi:sulfate transport system ATP-binding protein
MNQGRIEQDDAPDRVYAEPASAFVFDFLGRSNRLDGAVRDGLFTGAGVDRPLPAGDCAEGPATLFVRPHDLVLASPSEASASASAMPWTLTARVDQVLRLAGRLTVEAEIAGQARQLQVDLPRDLARVPERGEPVVFSLARYHVFPADQAGAGR